MPWDHSALLITRPGINRAVHFTKPGADQADFLRVVHFLELGVDHLVVGLGCPACGPASGPSPGPPGPGLGPAALLYIAQPRRSSLRPPAELVRHGLQKTRRRAQRQAFHGGR